MYSLSLDISLFSHFYHSECPLSARSLQISSWRHVRFIMESPKAAGYIM